MSGATHALVDAGWLQTHLDRPGLVVCDASSAMPGETFDARAAFAARHIPGARFLDLDAFVDPDSHLPHTVPSPSRFARLAGGLGIGNGSTVVFYESRALFSAPRAWFLFRLFGLDDVHVLDGGLAAWQGAGGPVAAGEPTPIEPALFAPHARYSMLAGLGDIERLASGDAVILDARSSARFSGDAPEPRPGLRSGHIPGSRNLPFGRLLAPDGRFHEPDRLRALFAELGVADAQPVVTSCGSGITAAVLTLGLHVAGFPEPRLFDGAWTEYALAHPDLA